MKLLTHLEEGKSSTVKEIDNSLDGAERRRLLDLGIYPGVIIKNCFKSVSGDPIAFEVLGTVIALRKEQSNKIHLEEE